MRPPQIRAFLDNELVVDSFAGGGGASTGIETVHSVLEMVLRRREDFESRVKLADGDLCWEWQGNRMRRSDGSLSYGRFFPGGRGIYVLAHRAAFMLAHEKEPEGVVRHTCDNVGCVRHHHLLDGTQAQNLADMRERGRAYFNRFECGTAHPNAKIDEATVAEILRLRSSGLSLAKIGIVVGLHASTVHDVVTGKTWKRTQVAEAIVRANVCEQQEARTA